MWEWSKSGGFTDLLPTEEWDVSKERDEGDHRKAAATTGRRRGGLRADLDS